MTVVVDINVLLDVFQKRQPFYASSSNVVNEVMNGALKGICSSHGLATLFYLVEKHASTQDVESAVDQVLSHFEVQGLHAQDWQRARQLSMPDLEDAAVAVTAEITQASFIITRNVADFAASPVPAITPEVFVQRFLPPQ